MRPAHCQYVSNAQNTKIKDNNSITNKCVSSAHNIKLRNSHAHNIKKNNTENMYEEMKTLKFTIFDKVCGKN